MRLLLQLSIVRANAPSIANTIAFADPTPNRDADSHAVATAESAPDANAVAATDAAPFAIAQPAADSTADTGSDANAVAPAESAANTDAQRSADACTNAVPLSQGRARAAFSELHDRGWRRG